MDKFSKMLVILAIACLAIAIFIKLTTLGKITPGLLPVNWAKLADTFLLFSIATSLLGKK